MQEEFRITDINRVFAVRKEGFHGPKSSYSTHLRYQELIFHFSGQNTVYFGDAVLYDRPNTIRYLPRGEAGRYEVVREEAGECIDVYFETDRPVSAEAFSMEAERPEKVATLFKQLFATWVSKKEGYYFEAMSLLYRIFAELQRKSSAPAAHKQKLAPALERIRNDFLKKPLSVEELAADCRMGSSYFQKLFKESYGVSPKKYIIWLKLNYACDLLQLNRYSVTQIAEMCCFSDVYFFSRQFKEYMGVSPTQYAKSKAQVR